jgi:tetratricopeptide (TPR) repeat protein
MLLNCCVPHAHACAWLYRSLLNGIIIQGDDVSHTPQAHFNRDFPPVRKELHQQLLKAERIYHKTHNIKDYSDYGAMLMYNGQYTKAQKIFQEIEKKKHGVYATAANLGTVDELLGQNQQAYNWIKRAIEINPNSHHGSEWIHLKVLAAKVHANGNPDYYRTHDILGLNFGSAKIPVKRTTRDLHKTKEQLFDQLAERMTFIPPKDPVVAQLLFDAGNITAITDDVKTALDIYEEARRYGYSSPIIDMREKYFQQLQKKADEKLKRERSIPLSGYVVGGAILLILLGIFVGGIMMVVKIIKVELKRKIR